MQVKYPRIPLSSTISPGRFLGWDLRLDFSVSIASLQYWSKNYERKILLQLHTHSRIRNVWELTSLPCNFYNCKNTKLKLVVKACLFLWLSLEIFSIDSSLSQHFMCLEKKCSKLQCTFYAWFKGKYFTILGYQGWN